MKKAEFLNEMVGKVESLSKKEAEVIYEAFGTIVKEALEKGESVTIPHVGKIEVVERAERECLANPKDPSLGKKTIPAHKSPKFKASSELKESVK